MEAVSKAHADAIRHVYPSVLAKALHFTRSLAEAEDAVHDAVERALQTWDSSGVPDSAEAWLFAVARNSYLDRVRRSRRAERHKDAVEVLAELSPWARIAVGEPEVMQGWKDDLLRLLFSCCHPALDPGESAALALSTVVGLSVGEIASAFLVPPRTMEQRLTRARQRLREKGDIEGTTPERSQERTDAVLRAIHLLFNEGYWSSSDKAPIRADLCRLAIGLARSLCDVHSGSPEAAALLALLWLHDARRDARLDEHGGPIPLPEQDRSRWDREAIARATELLERALSAGTAGPLQIEAAIAAVHCRARTAEETEWTEIASLYALLEQLRPTPAVRVNRAFAVGRCRGPDAGLALLDRKDIDCQDAPYVHVVRGTLLAELGDRTAAKRELDLAKAHVRNVHERRQIQIMIDRMGEVA